MDKRIKIGSLVTATRTYNGEPVSGKFLGYKLFNAENPDSIVGTVECGENVYDVRPNTVKLMTLTHVESEVRKIMLEMKNLVGDYIDPRYIKETTNRLRGLLLNEAEVKQVKQTKMPKWKKSDIFFLSSSRYSVQGGGTVLYDSCSGKEISIQELENLPVEWD